MNSCEPVGMFKFLRRFLREEQDPQVLLREKFHHFCILLESNNQVLSLMGDMEEKACGDYLFDAGYLKSRVGQLGTHVARIIQELGHLTDNRYPELVPIHQEILAAMTGLVMNFARQLDLALSSEDVVDRCLAAFKAKDYGLSCLRPDSAARGN